MSIPLVRNNTKDAINTSIIAIKKNLERINTLLGLVDSSEPDLSGFATKQELEDTVTEINNTIDEVETSLQPVDTVTSGNMHSVTSNAVYLALENCAKVRKSSVRSTIDEMLADLGIIDSYVKVAFNKLNTNIDSYTSGIIQISTGGPVFGFILYKLTNVYYSAEFMSYDSALGLNIIKFCKSNTKFQGIHYYI